MLRELRIRNFAVIESVAVEFRPGLNVLTGETGAGKSMLIDAILLVLGGRAQTDVIRSDADAATLEAVFDVEPRGAVVAALDEAGLALDDGLLVARRELGRSGRHRAFVNDAAVSVGLLERLGDHLVEVHGQHEHQRLLEPARQLELLDRFADTEELRERVAGLVATFRAARAEAERMRAAERDRAQREDLLRFQLSELDGARLRPGEEEELRQERRRRQHADKLTAGLADVAALLDDDRDSATARLHRVARVLGDLARLDPAFAAPIEPLDAAQAQLEEVRAAVRGLRDSVTLEPGRLEGIDERLDALTRLKRKYGDTEEAMLKFRDEVAAELDRLARHEEILAAEERRLGELHAELAQAATALSERRRAAAERLAPAVERELRALGMERSVFRIGVERAELEAVSPRGLDPLEPPGRHGLELRPLHPDPEYGALHSERPQLSLHGRSQALRRSPPPLGERGGRLGQLGMELAQPPLLRGEDLLVAREAVELGGDLVAELEHRLLGVAVLPLEAREGVEPLVDPLESARLERHRVSEPPDRRPHLLELRLGRVERLDGRGERGVETRQVAEDPRHAVEPCRRGVAIVVQERRDVGEPRSELVGVLTPPPLLPEFLLLARAQTRAVELGELEAQEILALGAVALGGTHPLRLGARGAERRHEARHALPELLRVGEAVQELELAGGLKQALVLVLAMHLDEVVAEAFEEPDADSRVVDEGAVAARATELAPRHQETVVEREPRLIERRDDGAARLDVEDRLERRGVGVASGHVSLGAPAED